MGCYVNPENQSKEDFINENGKEILMDEFQKIDFKTKKKGGLLALMLMDNGPFTALGVCFSENELKYFQALCKDDNRPLKFYLADIDKLMLVSDLDIYME